MTRKRRKELEKLQEGKDDDADFLLDEIASIAGDYYASLKGKTVATPQP